MKDYEYRDENGNLLDYYTIVNDATQMLREIDKKDKEIERLNNDIKILLKENDNKEKVIIKQNNIIDELEKYFEYGTKMTCGMGITSDYIYAYENALNKLQELKGVK